MKKEAIFKKKNIVIILLILIMVLITTITSTASKDEIDSILNKSMSDSNLPGMAVGIIKNGESIYSDVKGKDGYGEELTETSPMFIGSVSKSFTALAVMQLVEEGLVLLDTPIIEYISYFRVANPKLSESITVRQLLVQQTGLSRKQQVTSSDYNATLKERVQALSDMEATAENGKEFNYLNDHYTILGLLIEEVTGKSYANYMEENVFNPMGMINTTADKSVIEDKKIYGYTNMFGFKKRLKEKVPLYDIPGGYIVSNLQDMQKYVSFLIEPDETILSKESINEMRMTIENSHYAMGWGITEVDDLKIIAHSGLVTSFSAHVAIMPEIKSGYVYIINKGHIIHQFDKTHDKLNNNLLQVILDKDGFEFFPSIWLVRLISLIILMFTLKDLWETKKLLKAYKSKKDWIKEGVKAFVMLVFLLFGLPYILINVLGLGIDLEYMLGYAPDFTILLLVDIAIQVIILIIVMVNIIRKKYKSTVDAIQNL